MDSKLVKKEINLYKRYETLYSDTSRAFQAVIALHLTKQLEGHFSPNLNFDLIVRYVIDISSDNLFSKVRVEKTDAELGKEGVHELTFAKVVHTLAKLLNMQSKGLHLTKIEYEDLVLSNRDSFYLGSHLSNLYTHLLESCRPLKEGKGDEVHAVN